ncbi:MAG TPA: GTPase domain-containing protein, partial [Vicinamibacteria bacterium]|nr:GTPase domain-containing protein [Vicinamibacteria bacterium]
MVDVDHSQRVLKVKLVYYGPAVGGKTTNLKVLFERAAAARRGQFVSVNSAQDRTILCDLLPLRTGGFRGYDLKVQLLAVPGQAMYAASRRVVLKGADGVAFVANSAEDRWRDNEQSLQEMVANLLAQQVDAARIPLVMQYNKRDLPAVLDVPVLSRALNPRRVPEFPAVAARGEGVLETFTALLRLTLEDLCRRYTMLQLPPGQTVEAWVAQAVEGMFGAARLATPEEVAAAAEAAAAALEAAEDVEHLKLRVPTAEEPLRETPGGPEIRSTDGLTESYAQASAELGFLVSELREARDLQAARLDEVRQALELATEGLGRIAVEDRLEAILKVLVKAGGASGATLLLFSGESPQVLALPPVKDDPLSRTTWGKAHVEEAKDLTEPRLEEASRSPQLAQALCLCEPYFEAVALVPLRSAERLLGLALLYFDPYAPLPPAPTIEHLGFLARVLSGPLEASAVREAASAGERLKVLSRASAAAVASLLTRLPWELAGRRTLRMVDVLGPLAGSGVTVHTPTPGTAVLGDAALLRFAFATLVRQCEADALERGQVPEVSVQVEVDGDAVHVLVTGGGRASL